MTIKEEMERQMDEALKAMREAWSGYREALGRGDMDMASNYLSGFCTHLTTVERILDIRHKAHELGLNPGIMSEEERKNAIRIAKDMFERGETEDEVLDTLSKTFEATMDELRNVVYSAKHGNPGNPVDIEEEKFIRRSISSRLGPFEQWQKEAEAFAKNEELPGVIAERISHVAYHAGYLREARDWLTKVVKEKDKLTLSHVIGEEEEELKRATRELGEINQGLKTLRKEGWDRHYSDRSKLLVGLPIAVGVGILIGWYIARRRSQAMR